ncbi:hypothetical protein MBLNU459_g0946t2 [Dothideomycetes sp. NU459]
MSDAARYLPEVIRFAEAFRASRGAHDAQRPPQLAESGGTVNAQWWLNQLLRYDKDKLVTECRRACEALDEECDQLHALRDIIVEEASTCFDGVPDFGVYFQDQPGEQIAAFATPDLNDDRFRIQGRPAALTKDALRSLGHIVSLRAGRREAERQMA